MVIHILKDGSVRKDLTGHIVRVEDAGQVYRLMSDINREIHKRGKKYEKAK